MVNRKAGHGFSLIELMVVIAIVALLAAVAVPSYISYQNRTILSKATSMLQTLTQQLYLTYNLTGAWPASGVSFAGYSLPYSTYIATPTLNASGIYFLRYDYSATTGTLRLVVAITGLKDLGAAYIDPSTTPSLLNINTGTGFYMESAEINSILNVQCGVATPTDTSSVPQQVLPSACTCQHLNNFFTNNGAPGNCP